jgi:hypothetical protein
VARSKAKTIEVTPSTEHPVPYDDYPDETLTLTDELAVAANTAELLEALGAPVEVDRETLAKEKKLLDAVVRDQKKGEIKTLPAAIGAASFLRAYGQSLAIDINQVRSALTNKLLEIADCGDIKYELRAIELLGKHSDIGLFTERSEININYNSPESLEAAIKERVKRLLNSNITDIKPLGMDLEEELGLTAIEEGEWEDVEAPEAASSPVAEEGGDDGTE